MQEIKEWIRANFKWSNLVIVLLCYFIFCLFVWDGRSIDKVIWEFLNNPFSIAGNGFIASIYTLWSEGYYFIVIIVSIITVFWIIITSCWLKPCSLLIVYLLAFFFSASGVFMVTMVFGNACVGPGTC